YPLRPTFYEAAAPGQCVIDSSVSFLSLGRSEGDRIGKPGHPSIRARRGGDPLVAGALGESAGAGRHLSFGARSAPGRTPRLALPRWGLAEVLTAPGPYAPTWGGRGGYPAPSRQTA